MDIPTKNKKTVGIGVIVSLLVMMAVSPVFLPTLSSESVDDTDFVVTDSSSTDFKYASQALIDIPSAFDYMAKTNLRYDSDTEASVQGHVSDTGETVSKYRLSNGTEYWMKDKGPTLVGLSQTRHDSTFCQNEMVYPQPFTTDSLTVKAGDSLQMIDSIVPLATSSESISPTLGIHQAEALGGSEVVIVTYSARGSVDIENGVPVGELHTKSLHFETVNGVLLYPQIPETYTTTFYGVSNHESFSIDEPWWVTQTKLCNN